MTDEKPVDKKLKAPKPPKKPKAVPPDVVDTPDPEVEPVKEVAMTSILLYRSSDGLIVHEPYMVPTGHPLAQHADTLSHFHNVSAIFISDPSDPQQIIGAIYGNRRSMSWEAFSMVVPLKIRDDEDWSTILTAFNEIPNLSTGQSRNLGKRPASHFAAWSVTNAWKHRPTT